jgi:hypothetical protein
MEVLPRCHQTGNATSACLQIDSTILKLEGRIQERLQADVGREEQDVPEQEEQMTQGGKMYMALMQALVLV